jgi:hypothetical protein
MKGSTQTRTSKTRKSWYYPKKYFAGLSKTRKVKRLQEIKKYGSLSHKNPKAYLGFKTNLGVKTKKSGYTQVWDKQFPGVKSIADRAKVSGVPQDLLQESYDRGMAAWRTGHRPGATQQQWGYARVSSLLTCGKTHYTTDSDLVRNAKQRSRKAKQFFKKQGC